MISQPNVSLIDGDLVAYIASASCEKREKEIVVALDPEHIAHSRAGLMIHDILAATKTPEFTIYISGGNNFRYNINPDYKKHRTAPDPVWRNSCIEFLIHNYGAIVTEFGEADDALGIAQCALDDSIICSIDKDLDMIPGLHYSWPIQRKGVIVREASIYEVSEIDGIKSFYRSLLVGDRVDYIFGINGIGKVKAGKIIDPLDNEKDMFNAVRELYEEDTDRLLMNGQCLWILREEGKIWQFPK